MMRLFVWKRRSWFSFVLVHRMHACNAPNTIQEATVSVEPRVHVLPHPLTTSSLMLMLIWMLDNLQKFSKPSGRGTMIFCKVRLLFKESRYDHNTTRRFTHSIAYKGPTITMGLHYRVPKTQCFSSLLMHCVIFYLLCFLLLYELGRERGREVSP